MTDPQRPGISPVATLLATDRLVVAWMRHAHYHQPEGVPSAHLPHPLTDRGFEQAQRAGQMIGSWALTHGMQLIAEIDSSPLLRAWQTAKRCAEMLSASTGTTVSIAEHEALMERSVGAAANLSIEEIETIVRRDPRREALPQHWKSSTDVRLPFFGAESLREAGMRVAEHMRGVAARLAATQEGRALKLVIGHGASMRHAACELGLMSRADVAARSMHYATPIYFALRRATWVQVDGDWKHRDPGQARD